MTEQESAALLRRFLASPQQHAEELRGNLPAVLRTLVSQPKLMDELDAAEIGAPRLYDLLQGSAGRPQLSLVEDVTNLDASDDDKVRSAVSDLLRPLCSAEELTAMDGFDPLQVFQAAEAMSTLMRRHVRRAKKFVRVHWRRKGAMRVVDRLLPPDALALEVARFADLFDSNDQPTAAAPILTDLIWALCRKQPNLLRHFRVGWSTDDSLELEPIPLAERTDNLSDRWAPVSRLPLESWHGTVIMRTSERALAVAIKGSGPADDMLLSAIRDDMHETSATAALYDGRFVDVLDPWLDHDSDTPSRFQLGDRQWQVVGTAVVDDVELTDSGFDLINADTRSHVSARCLAGLDEGLSEHQHQASARVAASSSAAASTAAVGGNDSAVRTTDVEGTKTRLD